MDQDSIKNGGPEKDKYALARRKRQEHTDAVMFSASNKKIVVGGPGTGKTHLFKSILKGKKKPITLTFVNALVEDLSLDLCGLSEVKTLHSFARGELKRATGKPVQVFPKLAKVITEDARILLNEDIDFDYLFHNRDDGNKHIAFYKKRKTYYGHYGYSDVVFEAVKYFEHQDNRIPTYGQIVVDEFQDFNALEVSLIDVLAKKSPILVAGDDDQALYESLKSASSKHIRQRFNEPTSGYAHFTLPHCSRCTRVIVEAFNDIVTGATKDGHLTGRIPKPFEYFDDQGKDKDSEANPLLIYSQVYARQIPWFIQKHIAKTAEEVRGKFTVLIICPTNTQCNSMVVALRRKGFQSVASVERKDAEEPTLLDGLKLLLEDDKCNLGWRITGRHVLAPAEFGALLKQSDKDSAGPLGGLIEAGRRKEVSQMLTVLRAVRDGRDTDEGALVELLKKIDRDAYGVAKDRLRENLRSDVPSVSNPGIRKTPITVTTLQGAKGLDADYVFITHLDDQYFVKDKDKAKLCDQDICNFLVALTRARKRVFLVPSNTTRTPTFLKWVNEKRIEHIEGT